MQMTEKKEIKLQRGAQLFKNITQLNILPPDIDETIKFYEDILGFRLKEKVTAPDHSKEIVHLCWNDTIVEMTFIEDRDTKEYVRLGCNVLMINVENMDQTLAYLANKGIELYWGPDNFGNTKRVEIRDPHGCPILFVQQS